MHYESTPRYWTSLGIAEIDFVQQEDDRLYPIEVKSGTNLSGKSLSVYKQKYNPELAIRYSLANLSLKVKVLNIPIFMADWAKQLTPLALKK